MNNYKKLLLFFMLFIFIFSSNHVFSKRKYYRKKQTYKKRYQKRKKRYKRKTSEKKRSFNNEFSEDDRDFENEKIIDQIDILKFNPEALKRKKAIDFLFDNIETAKKLLLTELKMKENEDIFLANIFSILAYSKYPFNEPLIEKLSKIQLNKPVFLFYLIQFYLEKNKKFCYQLIKKMFKSKQVKVKIGALKVIEKNTLKDFKTHLIQFFHNEKNNYIKIQTLKTLNNFKLTSKELDSLFHYFYSDDYELRARISNIFSKYPSYFDKIKTQFEKTNSLLILKYFINSLSRYKNEKSSTFQLEIIKNYEELQNIVIDQIVAQRSSQPFLIKRILKNFKENEKLIQKIYLNLLSTQFKFERKSLQIKIISQIKSILKDPEVDQEIFITTLDFILKTRLDNREIDQFLKKYSKLEKNWLIRLKIKQILDLDHEN